MVEYSEKDRELFALDIARELKTLSPENADGYRTVARRLVAAGIAVSMVKELGPVGRSRRDRLEYALARALVDLEAGPLGDAACDGYDQEILSWNINNLTFTAHVLELVWANAEPDETRSDDQNEQNLTFGSILLQDALIQSGSKSMIEDMQASLSRERMAARLREQGYGRIDYTPVL